MSEILLSHGSGGSETHELIEDIILKKFGNPILKSLGDSALIEIEGSKLAFTTDSFVINPIFFKGGNIGKLAVCGTVNDLAVFGATPLYISCSLIIEEGFSKKALLEILDSLAGEAKKAGVKVVTGDTKVVEKSSADKIFINTSGIGLMNSQRSLSIAGIRRRDKILINGPIADHGISVLLAREEFGFKSGVKSDCACLNRLIAGVLKGCDTVKFMRDPTRGGVATTANEITKGQRFGIRLYEDRIPLNLSTRAACELLGLDPLYIGNEGKVIMIVSEKEAAKAVRIMKRDPLGRKAAVIGEVTGDFQGRVVLKTRVGGDRIVDMLSKEALPRIC